jgi:hypothetical protein
LLLSAVFPRHTHPLLLVQLVDEAAAAMHVPAGHPWEFRTTVLNPIME